MSTSDFDREVSRIGQQAAVIFFGKRFAIVLVGVVLCMIAGALIHG